MSAESMWTPDEPTIRVSGVHKTYGAGRNAVHALRGVDLTVPRGDLVALTGRSGAGKTTLLSLLAGFLRADEG
jgi:putative ABC transport system ATP-binding protein